MGIFDLFRPADKPIENGVPGSAQVVSVSRYEGSGLYRQCQMNLVINAPNVTPTAVEFNGLVHHRLWPSVGEMLPVTVDPKDATRYSILWRDIPDNHEVARAEAQGIAAALQGDPGSLASLVGGGLLGDEAGTQLGATIASPIGGTLEPDDTVSKLERLAALKDRGAITEAEFAQEKKKLLG